MIKIKQINKAFNVAFHVSSLINNHYSTNEFKDSFDKIYTNFDKLIETLIDKKKTDDILRLIKCQYDLSRHLSQKENLLIKLRNIGTNVLNVSEKLKSQNKTENIKEYFPLMDEIMETMLMTIDVDLKEKSKLCASFLHFYGSCLNVTKDWINSIAIHNQAIGSLKTGFATKAYEIQELGHLYYNVGIAYKKQDMLEKARTCYEEAISVYKKANFTNVSRKQKCLKDAKMMLQCCSKTTYK